MPLPEEDQALEQVRAAQERAVSNVCTAEHQMIAAASPSMAAIYHELVGAEAGESGFLVERIGEIDRLAPAGSGMHVDFDDSWIGGHLEDVQTGIDRGRVTLDVNRDGEFSCARFDGGEQLEVILHPLDRRHENANRSVAHLDGECSAHRSFGTAGGGDRVRGRRFIAIGDGLSDQLGIGQVPLDQRIRRHNMGIVARREIGQRIERQTEADRRISRHEKQMAASGPPDLAHQLAAGCAFKRRTGST
jgi:hypothetical protein